jgi:hypothetical protein
LLFGRRGDAVGWQVLDGTRAEGDVQLCLQPLARQRCRIVSASGAATGAVPIARYIQPTRELYGQVFVLPYNLAHVTSRTTPLFFPRGDGSIDICYLPMSADWNWHVILASGPEGRTDRFQLAGNDTEQRITLR